MKTRLRWGFLFITLLSASSAGAADWPTARHDALRTAGTDEPLPKNLTLRWTLNLPKLPLAWPDQDRLAADGLYLPVILGKTVVVASSFDDSVAGYDLASGNEKWRFFASGPIRVTPAGDAEGRVFIGSDDGYLYAVKVEDGSLLWKFKGAPQSRLILGNGRLIDTWPIRGGPAVADGKVYFAAGVWPFMGIFLHCLDCKTGQAVWTNSGDGDDYLVQPHGAMAFGSIAPQGSLIVSGDKLLIPNGRAAPAAFDRATGKFLYFPSNGKTGGDEVVACGKYFFNGGIAFDWERGKPQASIPGLPVIVGDQAYCFDAKSVYRLEMGELAPETAKLKIGPRFRIPPSIIVALPDVTAMIRTGDQVVVGGKGWVKAMPLPSEELPPTPSWEAKINGTVASLAFGNGALLVVTEEGTIYCYDAAKLMASTISGHTFQIWQTDEAAHIKAAAQAVGDLRNPDGYALVAGPAALIYAKEIANSTRMHVILIEPDTAQVDFARRCLANDHLYGDRIAILNGDLAKLPLPPYFASLVMVDADGADNQTIQTVYERLHPYHGVAYFEGMDERHSKAFVDLQDDHAAVSRVDSLLKLSRRNGVPGGGDWTNENADAANTRVSLDSAVKAPLGILWFGGSSHDGILPRHGHGPQPQVIDGKSIVEGVDFVRAMDVYTGRVLWEASIPGVGTFYDNALHQPGANGTGSNFVSTHDGIYVANGRQCIVLNPETGKTLRTLEIPAGLAGGEDWPWSYINVSGDYIVGGTSPIPSENPASTIPKKLAVVDPHEDIVLPATRRTITNVRTIGSKRIWVMDRKTGGILWSAVAEDEFRNNGIVIGGGKLFAIDTPSTSMTSALPVKKEKADVMSDDAAAGKTPATEPTTEPTAEPATQPAVEPISPETQPTDPTLDAAAASETQPASRPVKLAPAIGCILVFDLATGKPIWKKAGEFGTWLSYSVEHDVLMEAGRYARDTLHDEPRGMRAWRSATGEQLWYDPLAIGPAMIHGRWVLKEKTAADLITGEPITVPDLITGDMVEWAWVRSYGCNTPVASQNLLTFRSGAAGFYDLARLGGTGNFGGFRSSCTNNLIVAGGVLCAPDYTRTCTCAYPIQTSVGMIPDAAAEMWTCARTDTAVKNPVRRLGVNIGAPGDRVTDDGTPWLEYPVVGGKSPKIEVKIESWDKEARYIRRHSSQVEGDMAWVTASGVLNPRSITIGMNVDAPSAYTVRLFFAQPAPAKPGEFVADIRLQGKIVDEGFDVVKTGGGADRSVIREYRGVQIGKDLQIDLKPAGGMTSPMICGVELIRER